MRIPPRLGSIGLLLLSLAALLVPRATGADPKPARPVDFNREIRPILSNRCFLCHGPDPKNRKGVGKPLRLDTEEGATADLGGSSAIVKGKPDESEALARIVSDDSSERMPPPGHGERLSPHEVDLLRRWIEQGAPYAKHWAYTKPARVAAPSVRDARWPRNEVDRFVLARLESEGLKPSPEADRAALIRRVALDLTGLPPTPEEVDAFLADKAADAYERLVDRLLARPAFGEHWGKLWLDLARYADSAGYADDPARTIWAYRDSVIRSFNANKPFDRFTIEQIAGDLLPDAPEDALIATAFHRNTLTNNEGGTVDEEFRNVAVVDRVNTTMAVWMGTTIACAQCHDHKYDPLSQAEYFKLFAFFNSTQDADRTDESPVLPIFSDAQKAMKAAKAREIAALESALKVAPPGADDAQRRWEAGLGAGPKWTPLKPASATARSGATLKVRDDRSVAADLKAKTDVYTIHLPIESARVTALRLDALTDDTLPGKGPGHAGGNFVISKVSASVEPPPSARPVARYVRIELPGENKILSLAEVQVFSGTENVARGGEATQSSTVFDGKAARAVDGKTDGRYFEALSTSHTDASKDPWWQVDLKTARPIDRVVVWNRTDADLYTRLANFKVILLDESRRPITERTVAKPPNPSGEVDLAGPAPFAFAGAFADYTQPGFDPADVLKPGKAAADRGWAVGGKTGEPHALTLVAAAPVTTPPGSTLVVTIEQTSRYENHTIGRLRLATADDPSAIDYARTPAPILAALKAPRDRRTDAQRAEVAAYYLAAVAPELKPARDRLAAVRTELAAIKPETTVPILRDLPSPRVTKVQRRGNYLDLGETVTPDVPAVFPPLPAGSKRDRLALARWLVSAENPLTARVVANRAWEAIFGVGIVATSEEFGAQGDGPSHPELLDWLANDLVGGGWDLKRLLRLLVTSAAYRQSSRVAPDAIQRDPDNRLLARGPRFRLSAETIRDQALAVSGLLSPKMFGPPVRPPQPSLGLTAAFGSATDWQTSGGEDKYRRGIYTTWRRSSPYPSMATFDAPNREVCTLRRTRTNTPLQALVTMNDPVYVEAAQALARRLVAAGPTARDRARVGVKACLARDPSDVELDRLVRLFDASRAAFSKDRDKAAKVATDPLGPAPKGADVADLAAWTVVGNVLLNLDEMLMKR